MHMQQFKLVFQEGNLHTEELNSNNTYSAS